MRNARTRVLAGLAVLAVIGAACASNSSSSSAQGAGTSSGLCASIDTSAADALANVCSSGTLRVATDAKYAPQSSFNVQTGQWQGFDVDVANEIASRLGVTPELQDQKWGVITAGSWNDRWDDRPREALLLHAGVLLHARGDLGVHGQHVDHRPR